jgi:predicted site-specific integrase-resolvase
MNVSISQAHKLTGVARSTIYKDIDEGKLSVTTSARGKRTIMVSELQRVYGDIDISGLSGNKDTVSENVAPVAKRSEGGSSDQLAVLQERIEALKSKIETQDEVIDDLKKERKRSQELYEDQLDILKEALNKAQDGYNSITKLLEDKSSQEDKSAEWQKSIKALEKRITNQETETKAEKEKAQRIQKQNHYLKKVLEEERNKSLFERLFSKKETKDLNRRVGG